MSGSRLMQNTIASNQNVIITIAWQYVFYDNIKNISVTPMEKSILQIFRNQQKSTK